RIGMPLETKADIAAIYLLIFAGVVATFQILSFTSVGIVTAVAAIASGVLSWLLFRCIAEHLRLQKKMAGVPFEGRITPAGEEMCWAGSSLSLILR
uniref:hypothetical protein n=1 Tax=uncultured Lentibacter sp. TaxID=1659309 RepID=UPI002604A4ED